MPIVIPAFSRNCCAQVNDREVKNWLQTEICLDRHPRSNQQLCRDPTQRTQYRCSRSGRLRCRAVMCASSSEPPPRCWRDCKPLHLQGNRQAEDFRAKADLRGPKLAILRVEEKNRSTANCRHQGRQSLPGCALGNDKDLMITRRTQRWNQHASRHHFRNRGVVSMK